DVIRRRHCEVLQFLKRPILLLRRVHADRNELELALAVHAVHLDQLGQLDNTGPAPGRPHVHQPHVFPAVVRRKLPHALAIDSVSPSYTYGNWKLRCLARIFISSNESERSVYPSSSKRTAEESFGLIATSAMPLSL